VRISLGGVPLGAFTAGPDWQAFTLRVPLAFRGVPVLRLDVPGWRPANTEKGSSDVRDLGVMVDRVRMEPGHGTAGLQ
jgi:hypothetical protein